MFNALFGLLSITGLLGTVLSMVYGTIEYLTSPESSFNSVGSFLMVFPIGWGNRFFRLNFGLNALTPLFNLEANLLIPLLLTAAQRKCDISNKKFQLFAIFSYLIGGSLFVPIAMIVCSQKTKKSDGKTNISLRAMNFVFWLAYFFIAKARERYLYIGWMTYIGLPFLSFFVVPSKPAVFGLLKYLFAILALIVSGK
jgi:hypothetical protein